MSDPYKVLEEYCAKHGGTLLNYDWLAGTTDSLTSDLVSATRRPWMNSRISNSQRRWFVELNHADLWAKITKTASLREADPAVRGGLYDTAESVYRHFFQHRPALVGRGKINKCLYLMRPHLFPILGLAPDQDLSEKRREKRRASWPISTGHQCSEPTGLPSVATCYAKPLPLQLLRERAADADGLLCEAGKRLSDIRLLDILAWSPRKGSTPQMPSGSNG